jgi:hypothetical protein
MTVVSPALSIFTTQYHATSPQDVATAHTHKILDDNKALLQQPETTNWKAVVTKLTDAQLEAAALGNSPTIQKSLQSVVPHGVIALTLIKRLTMIGLVSTSALFFVSHPSFYWPINS